jgi:hypothetical protein
LGIGGFVQDGDGRLGAARVGVSLLEDPHGDETPARRLGCPGTFCGVPVFIKVTCFVGGGTIEGTP